MTVLFRDMLWRKEASLSATPLLRQQRGKGDGRVYPVRESGKPRGRMK